jgi:hypothetical protein
LLLFHNRFLEGLSKLTEWRVVAAAVLAGLSIMSHQAVAFGFVPIACAALLTRSRFPRRRILPAIVVLFAFLGPWMMWQKLIDPPGSQLTRFALTGKFDFSNKPDGLLSATEAAYSHVNLRQLLEMKRHALGEVIGTYIEPDIGDRFPATNIYGLRRYLDFFFVVPSLALLNVGWLVLVMAGIADRYGKGGHHAKTVLAAILTASCGMLVSCAVLWSDHILFHMPFVSVLILITALSTVIVLYRAWWTRGALILHVIYSFVVWGVADLALENRINWGSVVGAASCIVGAGLLYLQTRCDDGLSSGLS